MMMLTIKIPARSTQILNLVMLMQQRLKCDESNKKLCSETFSDR